MRTTAKLATVGVACLMILAGGVAWIHVGSTRSATVSPSESNLFADSPSRLATPGARAGTVATIRRGVPVAAETGTTASDPGSTTGSLRIHVVASADGSPLTNVVLLVGRRAIDHPAERIETGREEEYARTLRTNATGDAECELTAGSMYSVTALVELDGTSSHTTNWVQICTDQTSNLEIHAGVSAHPSCRGVVLDRDTCLPVGGATVSSIDGEKAVTTTARGEFALDASGWWRDNRIRVDAEGFSAVLAQLQEPPRAMQRRASADFVLGTGSHIAKRPAESGLTVFLRREAFLDGWLLDPAGAPVVETRVHAECAEAPAGETFDIPIVTTDEKGHFDFGSVPSGVLLSVGPKMSGTLACDVTLVPGERRSLTVRAQPYVELSGRVLDAHDEPIVEGGVSARCGDRSDDGTIRSDGTYNMPFLGPGRGLINVLGSASDNRTTYSCMLEIPAGVTEWTLDLRPTIKRSITGRVVAADGSPVIEGLVALEGPLGATDALRREEDATKEDGTFEFLALVPGTYELSCTPFETRIPSPKVRVVAGDGPVELHMPARGSIRGRVRCATGTVAKLDAVQVDVVGAPISAGVEEDGTFRACVPLGQVSIVAHDEERTSAIVAVDVHADGETVVPDLVVEATARLRLLAGRIEHDATYEVRRGGEMFGSGMLESNADKEIVVPCGALRVVLKNGSRDEAHEVTLAAGERKWIAVLRTP